MGQMMFPDMQRYISTMEFMGMGMGLAPGCMQRPVLPLGVMMPYPPIVGASPANLRPQLFPSFHPANVAISDQLRTEASNHSNLVLNSTNLIGPNMVQIPNFANPYHQYAGLSHVQVSSQVSFLH